MVCAGGARGAAQRADTRPEPHQHRQLHVRPQPRPGLADRRHPVQAVQLLSLIEEFERIPKKKAACNVTVVNLAENFKENKNRVKITNEKDTKLGHGGQQPAVLHRGAESAGRHRAQLLGDGVGVRRAPDRDADGGVRRQQGLRLHPLLAAE